MIAYSDYSFQGVPSTDILLLARSVRAFGGGLKEAPIRLYLAEGRPEEPDLRERALSLGVQLRSYRSDKALAALPFAQKAFAAASAEEEALAEGRSQLLWFDRDSLVTGDIAPLALTPGEEFGFRPVNAHNIGVLALASPSDFWARCYALGGVGLDELGTTRTYMGGEELHFYVAAGLAAVRPERGILRRWAELTRAFAADAEIAALCRKSQSRLIFLHQAAFTVAAASLVPKAARREYPADVMYPLNFWTSDDPGRRPRRIEEVRTLRYDQSLEGETWREFPMGREFQDWLNRWIR